MRQIGMLGIVLVAGSGCSAGEREPSPGKGESAQAIAGGVVDTENPSVAALVNFEGGACSGTTIAVNPPYGYLLTAAHCVVGVDAAGQVIRPIRPSLPSDLLVVPGNDWSVSLDASTYHPVHGVRIHPGYDGVTTNPNDVAIVRYLGATATTPVTPAISAAEDDLAAGTLLTYVGYGATPSNSNNSRRFRVDDSISALSASTVVHDNSDGAGTCVGDSGGPGLRTLATGKRVAAITSYGTNGLPCSDGTAVSVRVSAHASFIQQYLTLAPPAVSCSECRSLAASTFGGCSAEARSCAVGTPCDDYLACADACSPADTPCLQRCNDQHPQGSIDYFAYLDCRFIICSA
jgi:secreted trypsin-like serine protease